jgi:hypothetical protein
VSKGTCWECEAEGVHIHHHHVVPRSRGGTKTVPLCEACHAHAHHRGKAMTTSATTSAAMVDMRARGLYTGGEARYGYRVGTAGELVPDPAEQAALAAVRELRAGGLSLRATSAELARRGMFTRSGRAFSPSTLMTMEGDS